MERMALRMLYRLSPDFGGADVEENVVAGLLNLLPFNWALPGEELIQVCMPRPILRFTIGGLVQQMPKRNSDTTMHAVFQDF